MSLFASPRLAIRTVFQPWSLLALALCVPTSRAADAFDSFERDIRPVLVESCQKCHGDKKQQGGLRLDSRDALLKGGDNGPVIVPGKPDASLLIQAVRHTGELKMPSSKKLPQPQITALEKCFW